MKNIDAESQSEVLLTHLNHKTYRLARALADFWEIWIISISHCIFRNTKNTINMYVFRVKGCTESVVNFNKLHLIIQAINHPVTAVNHNAPRQLRNLVQTGARRKQITSCHNWNSYVHGFSRCRSQIAICTMMCSSKHYTLTLDLTILSETNGSFFTCGSYCGK